MRDWDSFLPVYMHGLQNQARMSGQRFLVLLGGRSEPGFTNHFARICTRLGLGRLLSADVLKQLYVAALFATFCSIAFNGLGGCGGVIKPELELQRIVLERDFMEARGELARTAGWRGLDSAVRGSAERIFLRVVVDDGNLLG